MHDDEVETEGVFPEDTEDFWFHFNLSWWRTMVERMIGHEPGV